MASSAATRGGGAGGGAGSSAGASAPGASSSSTGSKVCEWAGDSWDRFSEAAQVTLKQWTTLQLAVEQEWGGPRSNEKYDDLVDTLLDKCVKRWDRKQPYNEDEVWELLDAALTEQFNVVADDGSVDEVSRMMGDVYARCSIGDTSMALEIVAKYEKAKKSGGGRAKLAKVIDSDSSDSDGDDVAHAAGAKASTGARTMDAITETGAAAAPAPAPAPAPAAAADDDGWLDATPKKKRGKRGGRRR